jgi:hypothetical protein
MFVLKEPKRPSAPGWISDRYAKDVSHEDQDALRAHRMYRQGLLRVLSSYGRLEVALHEPVMAYFVKVSERGRAADPAAVEHALSAFGMEGARKYHESAGCQIFVLIDTAAQELAPA